MFVGFLLQIKRKEDEIRKISEVEDNRKKWSKCAINEWSSVCTCKSVHFDETLRAVQNELKNVLYMVGKPRMSTFQDF